MSDYFKEWIKANKYNTNTEDCWKKEEALKLADELENDWGQCDFEKASAMICRLVEELDSKQSEIDRLNLELSNPIDHEEWGKHQVACKHEVDDGACKECYEEAITRIKERNKNK